MECPPSKQQVSIEPARALKDAGFSVASSENQMNADTQIVVIDMGSVWFISRKPLTAEQKQKVMSALTAIQGAEILDRKKLDALGCHNNRSGD
jgi:hypothetical protein